MNRDPIKCDICGRFVSYDDLRSEKAVHQMLEPDNHFGPETWDTYHIKCKSKWVSEVKEVLEKVGVS
jgi:hypothetical protein